MAWRFVRQPNGLLARFSDVVDNFTDYDLSPGEAMGLCVEAGMNARDARDKVQRGVDDLDPWANRATPGGDGLIRWRDCLETIRCVHGKAEAAEVERELGIVGG